MKYIAAIFLLLLAGTVQAETISQAEQNSRKATCAMLRTSYARACEHDTNSKYCSLVPPGCPVSSNSDSPR